MGTPSLSLNQILNVSVVTSPTAVAPPVFNQALIVGPSDVIQTTGAGARVQEFSSLEEMIVFGFTSQMPEYRAAELYFGQSPAPVIVWIGRQDLTAVATFQINPGNPGMGYVKGDLVAVDQGSPLNSSCVLKVTSVGTNGAVTGLTVSSQGSAYTAGTGETTTALTGGGSNLKVDILTVGEAPVDAITACRIMSPTWYAVTFVGTATDQQHLDVAEYVEAAQPRAVYFLTTSEASILNTPTANLLASLKAANYRHTFSVYSTTTPYAAAADMGYVMGANTGAVGSYFQIMFKLIASVTAENSTTFGQQQVDAICGSIDGQIVGLNGNVHVVYDNGAYSWLQRGKMASGAFLDQVLFLDMLAADMQISGVNLLVSVPALPITDGGVTLMKNVMAGACERSRALGFVANSGVWTGQNIGTGRMALNNGDPIPNGYYLYAPAVASMSAGARANRQLPPITCCLIEAEAAQSASVTVFVQQ